MGSYICCVGKDVGLIEELDVLDDAAQDSGKIIDILKLDIRHVSKFIESVLIGLFLLFLSFSFTPRNSFRVNYRWHFRQR